MFNFLPNIIKNTFIYGISNSFAALIPFLLLPILTRYLTPEEYGLITIINITILFLGSIFHLEMPSALKREYIEGKKDFSEYISAALIIPIIILIISFVILFANNITNSSFGISSFWCSCILVISFGSAFSNYLLALYQIQNKAIQTASWQIIISAPLFFGTYIFLEYFGFRWEARIIPMLIIAIFIQIPFSLILIYKLFPYNISFKLEKLKELLRFSIPIVPTTIILYILQTADRIFVTEMSGLEIAGIYAVSSQLATILLIATNSFLPAWEVLVMQKLKENTKNSYKYITLFLCVFIICLSILAILIIVFFPYIMPYMLGKAFLASSSYLLWLIIGFVFRGIFCALLPFIYYMKKTKILIIVNGILVLLYCLLNYILIIKNGAVGAAQATLVIYIFGSSMLLFIIESELKFLKRFLQ